MERCVTPTRDVLANPLMVYRQQPLDFERTREIADQKARKLSNDPMLPAWYEAKSGRFSPSV
jgi:hypothetical protein